MAALSLACHNRGMTYLLSGRFGLVVWPLLAAAVLISPLASAQSAGVPCTLATKLDLNSYLLLSLDTQSEAEMDQAYDDYSNCQAAQLTKDLSNSPQVTARVRSLRALYRKMRETEGTLAYAMAGGGTQHMHAIVRSFPEIESTLSGLATLVATPMGGQKKPQFEASLKDSKQIFEARLKALKAWKPKSSAANDFYDAKTFQANVIRYAQNGAELMNLLGTKGDAATAAAYLPLQQALFVDEYLTEL